MCGVHSLAPSTTGQYNTGNPAQTVAGLTRANVLHIKQPTLTGVHSKDVPGALAPHVAGADAIGRATALHMQAAQHGCALSEEVDPQQPCALLCPCTFFPTSMLLVHAMASL